eukprot:4163252-Pleurochrysis_carterae.AAC.1
MGLACLHRIGLKRVLWGGLADGSFQARAAFWWLARENGRGGMRIAARNGRSGERRCGVVRARSCAGACGGGEVGSSGAVYVRGRGGVCVCVCQSVVLVARKGMGYFAAKRSEVRCIIQRVFVGDLKEAMRSARSTRGACVRGSLHACMRACVRVRQLVTSHGCACWRSVDSVLHSAATARTSGRAPVRMHLVEHTHARRRVGVGECGVDVGAFVSAHASAAGHQQERARALACVRARARVHALRSPGPCIR